MKHSTNKSESVSKKTTPKIRGVRYTTEKPSCCRRLNLDEDVVVKNVVKIYDFNIQSESSEFDTLFGTIFDFTDISTRTYHRVQEVIDPFTVLGYIPFDFNQNPNDEFNRLINGF